MIVMRTVKKIVFISLMSIGVYVEADQNVHNHNTEQVTKAHDDEYIIDRIEAVVYGMDGFELITLSDLVRPTITGVVQTLSDLIFESLVYLDAIKYKVIPDDATMDRYFASIEREHNMQPGEMDQSFQQAGYTRAEGREQLRRMQAVNGVIDFKIRSNLIVSRKDVEAYYQAHPEIQEAMYTLQYTIVPFGAYKSKEKQKQELIRVIKSGKGLEKFTWSTPFTVAKSDVAEDKDFLFTMNENTISMPIEVSDGFELYYLKQKEEERLKTLDERRQQIMDILRRPKYVEKINEYRDMLFENASILYLK